MSARKPSPGLMGKSGLRPDLAAFFAFGERAPRPIRRPRYTGVLAELAELGRI